MSLRRQKFLLKVPTRYREIRVENKLQDEQGNEVGLQPGAQVDVTIEADEQKTIRRKAHPEETQKRK
jgi:hypothetical protein